MTPPDIPLDKFPIELSPHVHMLGNYFFNLFLVTGQNRSALFETGVSGGVDSVIAQLEALGISPDYLIPSHPHSDHITGLPGLVERFPNAQVIEAQAYLETIDLIQRLDPLVVCPAHQGPLTASETSQGIQAARDITLSTIQRVKETLLSDRQLTREMFEQSYLDEFTLYTEDNIHNCAWLLIKRAREFHQKRSIHDHPTY